MKKFLLKLEVSRKQDYIFSSKKLRDNAARSAEIDFVTGHRTREGRDFFREAAGNLYDCAENLVYSGGGHAVLQFDDEKQATEFAKRVTKAAMERFHGMELFVKRLRFDENILGDERPTAFQRKIGAANLRELSRRLEEKKALRRNAVGQVSFGVEKMNRRTFQPESTESAQAENMEESVEVPDGCKYPSKIEHLCGEDNFMAVVHIDGNGMGMRVHKTIYDKDSETDWDGLRKELKDFSETVDAAFKSAFRRTAEQVAAYLERNPETLNHTPKSNQSQDPPPVRALPIRPVILAGDDVCFVTMGGIGLECARLFLENLRNPESGEAYYACAGVALTHRKYPFHKAYALSEELCSNAKKFVAEIRKAEAEQGAAVHGVSAIDWHIEFGQLRGDLDEIRRAYDTEDRIQTADGSQKPRRMELRPVVLLAGDEKDASKRVDIDSGVCGEMTGGVRTYDYFKALCQAMRGEYGQTARGKIKDLRTAFKQGAVESRYFLRSKEVSYLLYQAFHAKYRTEEEQRNKFKEVLDNWKESGETASFRGEAFKDVRGVSRCLFFDAVEMIDHFTALGIREEAET